MAYEFFALPVPEGADVEEAGEALLARLARGHQSLLPSAGSRARVESLAGELRAADPDLRRAPGDDGAPVELRARTGLEVVVCERFARLRVPFAHHGDAATAAFQQLFHVLAALVRATGWRVYDPQEAAAVQVDEGALEETLEIYLTVMDQLRAGGPSRSTGGGAEG